MVSRYVSFLAQWKLSFTSNKFDIVFSRFYDPQKGRVCIDGNDLKDIDVKSTCTNLRRNNHG